MLLTNFDRLSELSISSADLEKSLNVKRKKKTMDINLPDDETLPLLESIILLMSIFSMIN